MKTKLRHPVRAIREPFGTAGLIVACVALIAALGGSALAAKGALNSKQKKEVTAIAKKYAGKPGAPGATGPAGPQGNPGAAGAKGDKGEKGDTGASGADGNSVVIGNTPSCFPGGITVEVHGEPSTKQEVCNGEEGPQGPKGDKGDPGEPGVIHPGETLPSGATETGAWAVSGIPVEFEFQPSLYTSVSFPIPLAAGLTFAQVHRVPQGAAATGTGDLSQSSESVTGVTGGPFKAGAEIKDTTHPAAIPAGTFIARVISSTEFQMSEEATETHSGDSLTASVPAACAGGSFSSPQAAAGNLCMFEQEERNVDHINMGGTVTSGQFMQIVAHTAGTKVLSTGSWAVTAP